MSRLKKTYILHVDDDPVVRDLTRLAFELVDDFTVDTAPSGAAALDSIARHKPDLILLDVLMPQMDGRELKKILQNQPETADIPVIFMTALTDKETLDELAALDVLGIISKPFDAIALAEDLKHLIQTETENV